MLCKTGRKIIIYFYKCNFKGKYFVRWEKEICKERNALGKTGNAGGYLGMAGDCLGMAGDCLGIAGMFGEAVAWELQAVIWD